MVLLTVTNTSKQEGKEFSVNNISFTLKAFENMAIAGETGSGKTTLLKMIAGLIQPTAGEILFENNKVIGPHDQLIPGHPKIAYMSQYFELRNNYRVHEILEMANKLADDEAGLIFSVCQIGHLLDRKTDQLSGGEKQRIALARLLITSPKLLLLDEPFSNLDAMHKNTIKKVIHDIGEKLKITCIMVSHDAADILSWADTILVIKDGQIVQQGTARQIYQQPIDEYCAGLFGEYNLIDSRNPAFTNIPGMAPGGKKLLIRPEHFIITKRTDQAIRGIVQKTGFFGSYSVADVLVGEQLIKVKITGDECSTGDIVHLSVPGAGIWYI